MQVPTVSSKQIEKLLKNQGFSKRNGKGGHTIMSKGVYSCSIPHRREVSKGVFRNIVKSSGIEIKQFLNLL